jgi:hypothetical protein
LLWLFSSAVDFGHFKFLKKEFDQLQQLEKQPAQVRDIPQELRRNGLAARFTSTPAGFFSTFI